MTPIDLDAIIAKDMPAIKEHRKKGPFNLDVIVHNRFPPSVRILLMDIMEGKQEKYGEREKSMIMFGVYLSLVAHASKKRDTGGSYYIHADSVAKSIVQTGNEPYYTVIAALLHDTIEEGKYENRQVMGTISRVVSGLRTYALNRSWKSEYAFSICQDMVKVGIFVDGLTRREGEDYFSYIIRALSPKIRLGPMRKFVASKSWLYESVDEIIRSRMNIKFRDGWHNTKTLDVYELPEQLYKIYKNMALLSYAKRAKHTRQFVQDNVHYKDLIDASTTQISKIIAKLELENPELKNNRSLYDKAFKRYDKAGGFNWATMYRETKLPKNTSPEVKRIAEMMDGIMSRYAGFVHRMVEHPRAISMTPERLYVDCLDFMVILQKLRDDPDYAPNLMLTKREAGVLMRSLPKILM